MKLPTIKVQEINHAEAGKQIRTLRVKNNISLRRLAVALKISAPFLSDMELGRRGWSVERFELAQVKIKQIAYEKTN
jgi:transcriptional regulator with XRE-family HTH domain